MDFDEGTNPYTAGFGLWPPHFAGRQDEVQAIVNAVAKIKGAAGRMNHSSATAIVLLGPFGVGKTALLTRAMNEAAARGVHTREITRKLLSGPQKTLVSNLFPDESHTTDDFGSALRSFLSKKPLLLVLDEAHLCEPKSLNMLFEVVQICLKSRLPLALILAGTPGFRFLMQRCKANYVERSEFLRINTLSDDEAKEALEAPAKEAGHPMKPGALKLLLGWADN